MKEVEEEKAGAGAETDDAEASGEKRGQYYAETEETPQADPVEVVEVGGVEDPTIVLANVLELDQRRESRRRGISQDLQSFVLR